MLALILLTCLGCGLKREKLVQSRSPDGEASVIIWVYSTPPDYSVAVELDRGGRRVVYDRDWQDRLPGIVEVRWTSDSRHVTILVCDSGSPNLLQTYDAVMGTRLSSEPFRQGLEENLMRRYKPRLSSWHRLVVTPFVGRALRRAISESSSEKASEARCSLSCIEDSSSITVDLTEVVAT